MLTPHGRCEKQKQQATEASSPSGFRRPAPKPSLRIHQAMASTRQKQRSLSQNQSLRICKTSTNAFLSAIAYFRKIFPEDAFRDVEWADNVQFPTLTHTQSKRLSLHKDEDTNASLFAKWITENIYEMIDKKYLETLHLSISKANPDGTECVGNALQERYSLQYEYCDNGQVTYWKNKEPSHDRRNQRQIFFQP